MYLSGGAIDARGRVFVSFGSFAFGDDETYLTRLTADGRRDVTFDRMNSWMPILRGREHTAAWVAFVPDHLGRLMWWTELGDLQCCPWSGHNESYIGVLANGDVAPPEPTLRARFVGMRCGGRVATACILKRKRVLTVTGTLWPVPPAGRRDVYLTVARCVDFADTYRLRVDERGRYSHRIALPARAAVAVQVRREAWGVFADAAARTLWVGHDKDCE